MDPLIVVLTVVSSILAVFLIILGVQTFMVLREAQKTFHRVNAMMDVVENTALRALVPLTSMGGFMTGIKSGLRMFETFVNYLKKAGEEDDE
jgi:hypothetical protein